MGIYESWGFSANPFTTHPLPADDVGSRLLVGRDKELSGIIRRLDTPPKCVTIEGPNGIGKTSIVNVAAYRAYRAFLQGETDKLFIPCSKSFQLDPNSSVDEFIDRVLFEVAQTLLARVGELKARGASLAQGSAIAKWLNSPQLASWQGGLSAMVAGASVGKQAETNTSAGFSRSGFQKLVFDWLSSAFPGGKGGGVIVPLDNLELLQTSAAARQRLEALRDPLLTQPGLRWVLCGAAGIMRSVASSPRLEGVLHTPTDVAGVDEALAPQILNARRQTFSAGAREPYLPLSVEDFERLYNLLRRNIRNTLSKADDYCVCASEEFSFELTEQQKKEAFAKWLSTECRAALAATEKQLTPRSWQTFDKATALGGVFSPSDFPEFGYNSIQAMRPAIRDLEQVGLLSSSLDESDNRRKTIQVTSKGWMVADGRHQQRDGRATPAGNEGR